MASRTFGETGTDAAPHTGRPLRERGTPVTVPGVLDRAIRDDYGFVILGAGCSGLSLCHYLLDEGVDEPILILDRKTSFEDDRTWCFWDVEPTPFTHLARKEWHSWSFASEGVSLTRTTSRYPYKCLAGRDFYEHVLGRLARSQNVSVRLGEEVRGCVEEAEGIRIETSSGRVRAGSVFDGRGLPPGSPAFDEARRRSAWVPQQFLGRHVRTEEEVFDPERCTLMDFSVDQSRGLRFAYVLPMSGREALVENVYLCEARVSPQTHRAEIGAYLEEAHGLAPGGYEVIGEEKGYIPMTDYTFPRRPGDRVYNIGALGGETRPSTGYAFLRIQRYCRKLARAVATGTEPPARVHPRRLDLLDGLFLRFMRERPGECPEVYRRMFAGVKPDALVRFLTEGSTPLDEAALIRALPKSPFLLTAVRFALGNLASPKK